VLFIPYVKIYGSNSTEVEKGESILFQNSYIYVKWNIV
jgi:hypothetical protein